jgi:Tfp pilus assembly pilus retraction ATPase PilT
MEIDELLKLMVDEGASGLHLKVPSHPILRIDGALIPQYDLPRLQNKNIEDIF